MQLSKRLVQCQELSCRGARHCARIDAREPYVSRMHRRGRSASVRLTHSHRHTLSRHGNRITRDDDSGIPNVGIAWQIDKGRVRRGGFRRLQAKAAASCYKTCFAVHPYPAHAVAASRRRLRSMLAMAKIAHEVLSPPCRARQQRPAHRRQSKHDRRRRNAAVARTPHSRLTPRASLPHPTSNDINMHTCLLQDALWQHVSSGLGWSSFVCLIVRHGVCVRTECVLCSRCDRRSITHWLADVMMPRRAQNPWPLGTKPKP